MKRYKVMLIESELRRGMQLQSELDRHGYGVLFINDAVKVPAAIGEYEPDIIVVDENIGSIGDRPIQDWIEEYSLITPLVLIVKEPDSGLEVPLRVDRRVLRVTDTRVLVNAIRSLYRAQHEAPVALS
jgi:DNA-binding response OmpR family regulator